MPTSNGLGSLVARRPLGVVIVGLLTLVLTPFVFFPEIVGDTGVTDASALRNGVALGFLISGAIAVASGVSILTWRFLRRKKAGSPRR